MNLLNLQNLKWIPRVCYSQHGARKLLTALVKGRGIQYPSFLFDIRKAEAGSNETRPNDESSPYSNSGLFLPRYAVLCLQGRADRNADFQRYNRKPQPVWLLHAAAPDVGSQGADDLRYVIKNHQYYPLQY